MTIIVISSDGSFKRGGYLSGTWFEKAGFKLESSHTSGGVIKVN